jgi:allantoicase
MTFTDLIDLAGERLGGAVMWANDDFFAPKECLLKPERPVWKDGLYTDRGKWMDGWETRRRREPGHDSCLIRLGLPGTIRGVVVDTAFFRGNFPESCSIEATSARPDATVEELMSEQTTWREILPRTELEGDSRNELPIADEKTRFTHLRFHIYPDGGVARLRVHGSVVPDARKLTTSGEIDLAAAENGGLAVLASDMFFGERQNLIMPGRAANMGDGWETKRSRGPHEDFCVVRLAAEGTVSRIEIDTNHFKGNFPDSAMLEGTRDDALTTEMLANGKGRWVEIVPRTKLQAHTRHFFDDALLGRGPFTHVRLRVFPDGGVSRLRVHGHITAEALAKKKMERFDALVELDASRELSAICGAKAWVSAMLSRRPFGTLAKVQGAAEDVWWTLGAADWKEAFSHHPRIGERKASGEASAEARAYSEGEQSGTKGATQATMAALARENREYEERFGHVYLVCATGRSADEMLALLRKRTKNDPQKELRVAAEELAKITRIRLEKAFGA